MPNEAVEIIEALEKAARDARQTALPYVALSCDDADTLCGALRAASKVLRKADRGFTPAEDGKEALEIYQALRSAVLEFREGPYAELPWSWSCRPNKKGKPGPLETDDSDLTGGTDAE